MGVNVNVHEANPFLFKVFFFLQEKWSLAESFKVKLQKLLSFSLSSF